MRTASPLHWSALLFGAAALFWALTSLGPVAGFAAAIALLAGLAASVVALLAGLRRDDDARGPLIGGGAIAGIAHAIFVIAFVGANPVNFKGEPGRGLNQSPPALFTWLIDNVASWIPVLLVVAGVLAFWMLWSSRDRGLGAASLALLALVLVLTFAGLGDTSAVMGTLYQFLFAAAFLALAVACLLPLFAEEDWPAEASRETVRGEPV